MGNISLRKASIKDKPLVVGFDYRLDKVEHIELKREEKITKAILNKECFIIMADNRAVGFVLFDYRFFDQGWIELIIIEEEYRGKGIGGQTFDLLCKQCKTNKVFTSTNSSNIRMQKALTKVGFSFAGKIDGLDDGDPELFYYKETMTINKSEIVLKPFQSEDIPLFEKWLDKEYIYKRLCPDGEEQRKAWLDEIINKDGKYDFLTHFIVYHNNRKIGYCLHADCFFLKNIEEKGHDFEGLYGDVAEKNHTYEIGYLIGEEEYLNKGISKMVIHKLEEIITALRGKVISADPSEENIFSVKALLSNGFKKKADGDYRKEIKQN